MIEPWTHKGIEIERWMVEGNHGFVYFLTYPNGMKYIGAKGFHVGGWFTYCGGGVIVKHYLAKHGPHGIKREMISFHRTEDEMFDAELELQLQYKVVEDRGFYNLAYGQAGRENGYQESEQTIQKRRETMNAPEYKKLISEQSKALWNNPKHAEKVIKGLIKAFSDPVYKEKKSAESKAKWADPVIRNNIMTGILKNASRKEFGIKMSKISSDAWEDPEYRDKIIKANEKTCIIILVDGSRDILESNKKAEEKYGLSTGTLHRMLDGQYNGRSYNGAIAAIRAPGVKKKPMKMTNRKNRI